ncbi:MAG: MATE family efflux transporter [Wenzhouxiangellaceae bacterium]
MISQLPPPPKPAGSGLGYEIRRTLLLAGPLIIGQLTSFGMNFVDTVMAGRLGRVDLGAIAIGSSVWAAGLLFVLGVLMSVSPAVSQLDGAGRRMQAGEMTRQALWIALAISVLLVLVARNAGWVMAALEVEPSVAALALGYLKAMSWGAPALTLMLVLRFFSEGTGHTRPTMYIGVLGIIFNVPLNYILMFGKLGFEPMGAVGCGWATALVFWLQFIAMALYIRFRSQYASFELYREISRPNLREIRGLLRVGLPIGVTIFFEGSLFVSAALLIGTLGALPIAAHQVAINFASMAFMVPLGMAGAITVRVGNAIGRGDPHGARIAGLVGVGLAAVFAMVSAAVMFLLPEWIARMYTSEREVIELASGLLVLAAIFQLSDGLQVASAGALRGYKDTRRPMIYSVLSYWAIGLSVGYWLTFAREWGAAGMWVGMIAGLSVAALLLGGRFLRLSRAMLKAPGRVPP